MGTHRGARLTSWLLAAGVLQVCALRAARASYLCTAFVNVSFADPQNNATMWSQEESGLYGLDSPKVAVSGEVFLPDPIYGCEPDTVYDVPPDTTGWIALIQRGNGCTFSEKISVAARSGAAAAIIFNEPGIDNRVIQMSHPGTEDTVAIMIGYLQGMEIVDLVRSNIPVTVSIQVGKQHGPWMSHYSVFFVSISFFVVTAATVGYFIFYSARRLNSVRLQNKKLKRLKAEAKKAIRQLQVRTLRQGDKEIGSDADTCAVCIEVYKPGDVVSVLTCNHFFHKSCIEPWLLEHRTCPMCKCDILKVLGVEPDVEEEEAAATPDPAVPDFRLYRSGQEDTRSETASSGYASVQGAEEHGLPVEESPPHQAAEQHEHNSGGAEVQVDMQPHYDNMAFEGDLQNHANPRT
ncbi:E3 ubiquitin-protein ligase RNF128a isoform X1 [Scleropages formosus]|uniref:Ring finger protein 128a n=1 Tax=Scleropages formosus TaxID=113540 RepID=A0A8C9RHT0_SCLFO|nr:E3 ubiquitin-protein ligase RNF128 isoform X1 [Scleropages formosus]